MNLKVDDLIASITNRSSVIIKGKEFSPIAKAIYVTQSAPDTQYAKIFFEGHYALVISPDDEFMYFGRDCGNLGDDLPGRVSFVHNGLEYTKVAEDYQVVLELAFGTPISTEGEVTFWDYESSGDSGHIISLGLVTRTQRRADIVAEVLSSGDVSVQPA